MSDISARPLVSIITPCHNGEKYLSDCIESVLAQTYNNWEMLIVDDGSTDSSSTIIKEYSDKTPRIKYFKTEKASGSPALPRNIGMDAAQGQYIAFLDCDDLWLPSKLERQLHLFDKEHPAIVFSNYCKINENGERHNKTIVAPSRVDFKKLLKGNCLGNLTCMYDKKKAGDIRQKKLGHEDYLFWLSILQKGSFAINTNTEEAMYRVLENSVSSNKAKVYKWYWHIFRKELNMSWMYSAYCLVHCGIRAIVKYIK